MSRNASDQSLDTSKTKSGNTSDLNLEKLSELCLEILGNNVWEVLKRKYPQ